MVLCSFDGHVCFLLGRGRGVVEGDQVIDDSVGIGRCLPDFVTVLGLTSRISDLLLDLCCVLVTRRAVATRRTRPVFGRVDWALGLVQTVSRDGRNP